ncbi:MAG: hypothetical protein ABW360_01695 [Phenylobacterium sp.]
MIRTLVFVGALGALATPALASDLRVSLTGKTPEQINTDIRRAANKACADELQNSVASFYGQATCVRQVIAKAKAQLPAEYAAATRVATR